MKTLLKKLVVFFVLTVALFFVKEMNVQAAETYEGWKYEIENGCATIYGYEGTEVELVIPDEINGYKVRKIGNNAFEGSGMESLTIPEGVTGIGRNAFWNCTDLELINFNAKNCGNCHTDDYTTAFHNVGANTDGVKVVFGPKVERVPNNLFAKANTYSEYARIESVEFSNSIEEIGSGAFRKCKDLAAIKWGNSIRVIGENAFESTAVKNMQLPASLTTIENKAFEGSGMESLTIPEGVTGIGRNAFWNCTDLELINFNAKNCGNCHTDDYTTAFHNVGANTDGVKVVFGPKVERVPNNLFAKANTYSEYARIESVEFSNSIEEIGSGAFRKCKDLAAIKWGNSIRVIGENAFESTAVKNMQLPASLTTIENKAFYNCKMESLRIPLKVTYIGRNAFWDCTNLELINFNAKNCGNCHTDDYTTAFHNVGANTDGVKVVFGPKVERVPNNLFAKANTYSEYARIESVEFSNSIEEIGSGAFRKCKDLAAIKWGNSIRVIGENAFESTAVKKVVLPASVIQIDNYAFSNCKKLTNVTIKAKNIEAGWYAFENVSDKVNFKCLRGGTAITYIKEKGYKYTYLNTAISSITNTADGIQLKWYKVKDADGYYIYRKAGSGEWKQIKKTTSTSWTNTGLVNGTKYQYKIYPYNEEGKGSVSATKTIYRLTRVSINEASNSAVKKITIKYGKNAKATGYQIRYSTSKSFDSYTTIKVTSKDTLSKTISSLKKGKTYYLKVRAYKKVNDTTYYSAWSAYKTVKVKK